VNTNSFRIGDREIGAHTPVYFIADISANHDGDLGRAKALIHLAAESGAHAAKFQNFRADRIVSEHGFNRLADNASHQAAWSKPVFQVYQEASLPWEWTEDLKKECDRAGIHYFSTPYDLEAVDMLDPYVPAFKIGSGDITWPEMLHAVASKNKPMLLATGASDMADVQRAVDEIRRLNPRLALMQCNTNYSGSPENFHHINLNVLKTYAVMFPDLVLGLSDHTPGYATVLGAVALGARVVEKHFTDDNRRPGPDHPFSLPPVAWREMVDRTHELDAALGDPAKPVAENEIATVTVQRRCLRAARELHPGAVLTRWDIDVLRPAPAGSIFAYEMEKVLGKRIRCPIPAGEALAFTMLED
jgi:N-acetylneuraminate synthase